MKRESRKAYHHGDLRAQLLRRALSQIRSGGVEAFSLRKLARSLGVSAAAPYHHFPDKDALLAALAEEGFRSLRAECLAAVTSGGESATRAGLQSFALGYIGFARSEPERFRLMFGTVGANRAPYPELEHASEALFGLLEGGIEQLQRAGQVKAGEVRTLALAAWSLVHGFSQLLLDGQISATDVEVEPLAERLTELLMFGMASEPESTAPRQ